MANFPIEHLKAGGTASRAPWEQHGLRLALIPHIGLEAGGPPFKPGEQVAVGALFVVLNRDNSGGVWSSPPGDLLAEDWTLNPIEATEDPLA